MTPVKVLQATFKNCKFKSCAVFETSYEVNKQCEWKDYWVYLKSNSEGKVLVFWQGKKWLKDSFTGKLLNRAGQKSTSGTDVTSLE